MKKRTILILLTFCALSIKAQIMNIDSLVNVLNTKTIISKERLNIYEDICQHFYKTYETEKSIEYSLKGLKLAQKEDDNLRASIFYEYLGLAYNDRQVYDTAYIYYEKALNEALISKCQKQLLNVYLTLDAYYGQRSHLTTALAYFLKALSITEVLDNKEKHLIILGNIGSIYTMLNNHDKAIPYFEQLMKLSEEINYYPGVRKSYYELGEIYILKGKYDEALNYAKKVLDISRTHEDKTYETLSLQSLARIYLKIKPVELDLALTYAENSLNISKDINSSFLLSGALDIMSSIYLYQKRYKECEQAALEAYQTDSTNIQINMNIYQNLVDASIFLGDKKKASDYFARYRALKDQYANKNMHETLLEMEIKYETEKKEMRIEALEKEKEFYIWLGISGIIVLLLAIGLLVYRHRLNAQKHKIAEHQIKQLEQEKQLIATQFILEGETAERSRLARDLHDSLGSMLSVVRLNLKDMKSYSLMETSDVRLFNKAMDMLDKSAGELRRIAHHMMPESLIHHGLKTSLEDFCKAIPGAYFQYYGDDSRLDRYLELILYRCTYELVNNAIKHANATEINIQLIVDKALVSLAVQDNGKGFDVETTSMGIGLQNIRTRVLSQNGKMNIYSTIGEGTEINIEIERI